MRINRWLQGTQRPALATQGPTVLPDIGRKSSNQAAGSSDDQAARTAAQRLQDSAAADAGGTIDLNADSSWDEDVPMKQPAAPRRDKPAFVEVMLLPSCSCVT